MYLNLVTLVGFSRVVDHQVRLEADLRDPSWEGGHVRFAHHLHPWEAAGGSGRRYGDHSVQVSQRLPQRGPSLRPRPRQG